MPKLTKKERIMQFIEANGNKCFRKDFIKFIYEFNNPGKTYTSVNRGYYSTNLTYGGHLMKGGNAKLCKNPDKTYSVYRLQNDGSFVKSQPTIANAGSLHDTLEDQSKGRSQRSLLTGIPFIDALLNDGCFTNEIATMYVKKNRPQPQPKKIAFVHAKAYKEKHETDLNKVEKFINVFNASINKGDLIVNTGLDGIPTLNDKEFTMAQRIASEAGWILTQFEDNYNTTSYKMIAK